MARLLVAFILLLPAAIVRTAFPAEPTLVALLDDGSLVVFRLDDAAGVRVTSPKGVSGRLVGVDVRPADGRLYGLAGGTDVYRIDPASGDATLVSTLTVPFDGDIRSGFDFNPQADRLRLVSSDGRNLRVNVLLGATAVDAPLAYAASDASAGRRPRITAAAYANNRPGVATTTLYEVDAEASTLVIQDPPNDGILKTVGPLGFDVGPLAGFDITTDADGRDHSYLAVGDTLYTVDLKTGRATSIGKVPGPGRPVVSLAALPEAPHP
jgi:hypothetical protein